jgi:succinate dehydrogenase hydrophobic anchor subunit
MLYKLLVNHVDSFHRDTLVFWKDAFFLDSESLNIIKLHLWNGIQILTAPYIKKKKNKMKIICGIYNLSPEELTSECDAWRVLSSGM